MHVTEVESFLTTARRAGVKLTDAEVDDYYTEQLRAAELVGLDPSTVPSTAAEVAAYYRGDAARARRDPGRRGDRAVPDRAAGPGELGQQALPPRA